MTAAHIAGEVLITLWYVLLLIMAVAAVNAIVSRLRRK